MQRSLEKALQGVPSVQTGALCTCLIGLQGHGTFTFLHPSIHALISPTNIYQEPKNMGNVDTGANKTDRVPALTVGDKQ